MTTILADAKLGLMVSDSNTTDEDRVWRTRKVDRIRGALVATSGDVAKGNYFLDWYRAGAKTAPDFAFEDASALVLDSHGLFVFDQNCTSLTRIPGGREAIGSGGKCAIAAYEAMRWTNPQRAVLMACRHDAGSRGPVRVYRLDPRTKPARQ